MTRRDGPTVRLRRLVETIRRLRPSQPAHRLVLRLRRVAGRVPGRSHAAWVGLPALPSEARRPLEAPFDGEAIPGDASVWRFAGAVARLDASGAVRFDAGEPTALERYHLLYAEVVRSLAAAGRSADADRWLAAIVADGAPQVHPYVRARRILALTDAAAHGVRAASGVVLSDAAALAAELERDVRGNHLLANGAALCRAGHAARGSAARRWTDLGRTTVAACVREQVLPDGVHYERCPAYQGLVLEHLLGVAETAAAIGVAPPAGLLDGVRRLAVGLGELRLPDGELLRRGDGAPGLSLPTDALLRWAARRAGPLPAARRGPRLFPVAGLAVVEDVAARAAISLVACPPCPRDLPAHGHADALAVEVVLRGVRVVASAGTAAYGRGAARDADRRPGAFAGALVDGRAPADPWDAFRVGARGFVRRLDAWKEDGVVSVQAYGDGHGTAADPTIHRRVVAVTGDLAVVVDEWTGRGAAAIETCWPLAPGLSATPAGDGLRLAGPGFAGRWWSAGAAPGLAEGRLATGLGATVPRTVIRDTRREARPTRRLTLLAAGDADLSGRVVPAPGGALRIDVVHGGTSRSFHVPTGHRP